MRPKKVKMWAVCYEGGEGEPEFVPYAECIYHFRSFAVNHRDMNTQRLGRVLPVMVEVIKPKRRSAMKQEIGKR